MFFFFCCLFVFLFFFQAEDGIRDLVRSRGLGDVYKRQVVSDQSSISVSPYFCELRIFFYFNSPALIICEMPVKNIHFIHGQIVCLLYTSDAADERSSVDLGGRRIIKKKKNREITQ